MTAFLLSLYFVDASVRAAKERLWFDEFFTFHIARLGSIGEIWEALLDAADALPPLSFVLTAAAHAGFGAGEWATRLPSILAWGVASGALFHLIAKRYGAACGLAAMLLTWLTWGYEYAYEARPYSLVVAFGALGLLCWRALCEGRRPKTAALGLASCLAAAVSCHYYAVLLWAPLAAGEAARTWRSGKVEVPFWTALVVGASPLLAYLPLIEASRRTYSEGFWSPVTNTDILGTYIFLLMPALWPLAVIAPLLLTVAWHRSRSPGGPAPLRRSQPLHETVAFGVLAGLPVLAVALAWWVTKAYHYRYSLAAVLGIGWLFAHLVRRATGGRDTYLAMVVLALLAAFVGTRFGLVIPASLARHAPGSNDLGYQRFDVLDQPQALPIAVSSPILYPLHAHYAPELYASRLVYVSSPEAALHYRQANTPDLNLRGLARWAPLRVVDYEEFVARHEEFLIYDRPNSRFAWLKEKLEDDGRRLSLLDDRDSLHILKCCGR